MHIHRLKHLSQLHLWAACSAVAHASPSPLHPLPPCYTTLPATVSPPCLPPPYQLHLDFLDTNAQALVGLVASTLSLYEDLSSQRLVRAFAAAAAQRSEAFVKALAAAVVKAASSKPPPSRTEARVLLHWGRIVLLNLDTDSPATKKAVSKLVEVQGALLDQLSAAVAAAEWPSVARVVKGLLRSKPGLQADFLAAARSSANGAGIARALLESAGGSSSGNAGSDGAVALREQLLGLYVEKVLVGGRERAGPDVLAAYRPLLQQLSEEDLNGKVLPAVNKALRRVPDVAMGAVVALAADVPAALNGSVAKAAGELVPVLVQQMRLKESVRAAAQEAVRALAGRCADVGVLTELVGGVRKVGCAKRG